MTRTEMTNQILDLNDWSVILTPILDNLTMTKLEKLGRRFAEHDTTDEVSINDDTQHDAVDTTREGIVAWFIEKANRDNVRAILDDMSASALNKLHTRLWPWIGREKMIESAASLYAKLVGGTPEQAYARAVEVANGRVYQNCLDLYVQMTR